MEEAQANKAHVQDVLGEDGQQSDSTAKEDSKQTQGHRADEDLVAGYELHADRYALPDRFTFRMGVGGLGRDAQRGQPGTAKEQGDHRIGNNRPSESITDPADHRANDGTTEPGTGHPGRSSDNTFSGYHFRFNG